MTSGERKHAGPVDAVSLDRLAELAYLRLEEKEKATLVAQVAKIIGFFRCLQSIDAGAFSPTDHPVASALPLRNDKPQPGLDNDDAARLAPETQDGLIKVPRVKP